jgi:hypothetical protein
MTWMERFEETMKTPAIATPAWFDCIHLNQREEAHRLVAMGAPVCVKPATRHTKKVSRRILEVTVKTEDLKFSPVWA